MKLSLTSIKQHAETRRSDVKLQFPRANRANTRVVLSLLHCKRSCSAPQRTRSFSTTSPIDRELLRTAHPPSRQGRYLFYLLSSLILDFVFTPYLLSLRLSHPALPFRLLHNLHRIPDTHHVSPTSVRANRESEGPRCP
jgi:hypothetical protein